MSNEIRNKILIVEDDPGICTFLRAVLASDGYDVIIVGRGRAVRAEYREMEAAFEKVCRKLGLWEEQA